MPSQLPDTRAFDTIIDDKQVSLYILAFDGAIQCAITNYGARLVSLIVPGKANDPVDVALGYSSIEEYTQLPEDYMGAIVGRCANRIAGGHFLLDNRDYYLPKNNGENTLHGGIKGLHAQVWDVVEVTPKTITLHYTSPAGEEGFPGTLDITVRYTLHSVSELTIEYKAETDAPTLVNLSNHTYWNLSGEGSPSIEDHILKIDAHQYTPVNSELIPTGEIAPVAGTPFYFCTPSTIGAHLRDAHDQLLYGKGYDHNWVLDGGNSSPVALSSPVTGITMELFTDQPGMQFYSGNFLDGSRVGKRGLPYQYRSAVALEPQHFPDSIHHPNFPSVVLRPGQVYQSTSRYVFSIQ